MSFTNFKWFPFSTSLPRAVRNLECFTADLPVTMCRMTAYWYLISKKFFFRPSPRNAEDPRPWIKTAPLQWSAPQQWQHQILNLLSHQGTPKTAVFKKQRKIWHQRLPPTNTPDSFSCALKGFLQGGCSYFSAAMICVAQVSYMWKRIC